MKIRTTIMMEDNDKALDGDDELLNEYLRELNNLWDVTVAALDAESPDVKYTHEGTIVVEE